MNKVLLAVAIYSTGWWMGAMHARPKVEFVESITNCKKRGAPLGGSPTCGYDYVYHSCYDYEKYIREVNKRYDKNDNQLMVWETWTTSDPRSPRMKEIRQNIIQKYNLPDTE